MVFSLNKFATGLASGLASNQSPIGGLGRGFIGSYNSIKEQQDSDAERDAVGKILSGDETGWTDWGKVNPQGAMNAWNAQKQLEKANQITPYQMAMLGLKKQEIDAMKDAGKYDSPYERTLQQEEAKNRAEVQQKANALEAGLPAFEEMAKQLNEVGKDATYTEPGQAYDWTVRQLGLGSTKGANARERYRQIVNNELLPKLRETFGGQLSDAERESLLSTLGNVDLSAPEREQAVQSFIESKKRQLEGYKRQLGGTKKEESKKSKYTIEEVIE